MSLTTPTVRLPDRWSFFKMIATRFPSRMSLRFWPFIYVPCTLSATCGAGVGVLDGFHEGSRRTKGQPPASLTLKPRLLNSSSKSCRWSPWISIAPSFTVPPAPHFALSCLSSSFSCASSPGTPVITVTPLPLRPFVSLPTLTTPPPPRRGLFWRHAHSLAGLPHSGHILP